MEVDKKKITFLKISPKRVFPLEKAKYRFLGGRGLIPVPLWCMNPLSFSEEELGDVQ